MPWVRFTCDFDWSPRFGVTVAYKQGMRLFVTRGAAEEAKAKGAAVASTKPGRADDARG
jgi:hypothetical protein